ncbi:hypothetical protein [Stenotrophobium rhamnosiphilum]|uniref:SH3b domain-containing protein n=1 Tax=Stenotrophobium rhamnosiphilum TaxID=2029166 RepID=A0A2T5MK87_9GAMM|nr:hypothetical protein [Stenotrophobium rhamnosiphilum]PTU32985.1 hypothetical protein CJD38_02400 [Stenotrophobium rhamnosiphilum]
MIISFRTLATAATCFLLAACGMQPYKLPSNEPTAQLNLAVNKRAWICADGKSYALEPNQAGYVTIPAGHRIVVGSSFFEQGYNVQYSCYPRVNFVPKTGETYYQDFQIEAEKCTAFIYRETNTNPAGVDFEPSMRGSGSCDTVFWAEPLAPLPNAATPKLTFAAPSVATAPIPSPPQTAVAATTQQQTTAPREAPIQAAIACGDDIAAITSSLSGNSERKLLRVDCQLYPTPNGSMRGSLLSAGNAIELVRNISNAEGAWWYVKATGTVGWILVRR